MRRHAPATERNREPLLKVLRPLISDGDTVLEVASGSGEHAVFFSRQLAVHWYPTDVDPDALASIDAWRSEGGPHLEPAVRFDVSTEPSPVSPVDVMLAFNLIHISPWETTRGLMRAAGQALAPGGRLITYGPYKRGGQHTSESNVRFEGWLHSLDSRFGVRDLEAVSDEAAANGLALSEVVEMPANNFTLVFRAP